MRYKHYKGGIYRFLEVAKHTESGEDLVIYQGENGQIWARPYDMFFGYNDEGVLRFELIES